jgi:hypothetical protein
MSYAGGRSVQLYEASSESAMLSLPALPGDQVRRTDNKRNYFLARMPASVLSNWTVVSVYATDFAIEYPIEAWTTEGTYWDLLVVHNLNSKMLQVSFFNKISGVQLGYSYTVLDNKSILVQTPKEPDGRTSMLVVAIQALIL